ncbi:neuroglobin-1-like isoform X3 [Ruditapes philippinarum]|uniref:neuroglobin-1-like isoform X3 n=1 Tax=Ruditapes philippinarum TaxID=129788 RepID=UPI00295AB893|nr:neuroglobin-1-like isoform X3 [Ruditapes philippinarum]
MGNKIVRNSLDKPRKSNQLNTCLSPEQIELVQSSWQVIQSDLSELGLIIFIRFFETEPNMKSLFPKIVQMNQDNKLECNIDRDMLQKHAVTVLEGLGAAVESLDDSQFLNGVLIAIGQTHVQREVKPQMLKKLWPSLHYGLQQVLKEHYTKQVSEAWKKVFEYICAYMKLGMEHPDLDADNHADILRIS